MYEMMVRFFHIYSHFCFVVVLFYVLAVPLHFLPSFILLFLVTVTIFCSCRPWPIFIFPYHPHYRPHLHSPLFLSFPSLPFFLPVPPFAHHLYHLYLLKSPTSPFLPISDYRPLITNSPSFLLPKTDRSPSLLRRKRQCDVPTDPQRPALIP